MFSITEYGTCETVLFDKITPISDLEGLDVNDNLAFVQTVEEGETLAALTLWRLDDPVEGLDQLKKLYSEYLDAPKLEVKLFRLALLH